MPHAFPRYRVFVHALRWKRWWGRECLQLLGKGPFSLPWSAPRGQMMNDTISVAIFQELMTPENVASISPGGWW